MFNYYSIISLTYENNRKYFHVIIIIYEIPSSKGCIAAKPQSNNLYSRSFFFRSFNLLRHFYNNMDSGFVACLDSIISSTANCTLALWIIYWTAQELSANALALKTELLSLTQSLRVQFLSYTIYFRCFTDRQSDACI